MPYHEMKLRVKRDGKPKFDQIFEAFKKREHLFVTASLPREEENGRWRPKGWNIYEIRIVSIELLPDYHKLIPDKGSYYFKYRLIGQLVGMNGEKNKFPDSFSWPSEGVENKVKLLFSSCNSMELIYGEYITL